MPVPYLADDQIARFWHNDPYSQTKRSRAEIRDHENYMAYQILFSHKDWEYDRLKRCTSGQPASMEWSSKKLARKYKWVRGEEWGRKGTNEWVIDYFLTTRHTPMLYQEELSLKSSTKSHGMCPRTLWILQLAVSNSPGGAFSSSTTLTYTRSLMPLLK